MDHLEPGSINLGGTSGFHRAEVIAVMPVDRDRLQAFITNIRQAIFQGVQVPVKVTHIDPETDERWIEHVPGCGSCSI